MISSKTLSPLFILALLALSFISLPASSANSEQRQERAYVQSLATDLDFRDVSTLNEYTRLVYRDRWPGIDAEQVLDQLAQVQTAPASPAMREIWRDILLSDFSGLNITYKEQQTILMAERLRILNTLGFFDEAVRLYEQAAELKPTPEIVAREGINALALSGSADGACLEVSMATKYLHGDQWDQDAALCAAYFGEKERAKTLYDATADKGGNVYRAIYKMLDGQGPKAIQPGIPPLWRTLLLAKDADVTTAVLKDAGPITLASLAANGRVPLATRLGTASRAADNGTIGFDRLRKLYEMRYPSETGMTGIIDSAKNNGDLSQTEYYAAGRFTFEGNARSAIVKNALHRLKPVTNVKGHVFTWIVDKLTLQVNKLGWFAPEGYSLMMLTGRTASADMYYKAGNLDESPFAIINALQQGQPWSDRDRQAWENAMHKQFGDKASEKIDLMFRTALAYDQEYKLQLGRDETGPARSAESARVRQSVKGGGRGLTLVTALNILGQKRKILSSFETSEFADIIRTMTQQGLFSERKKIVLEFLIQNVL